MPRQIVQDNLRYYPRPPNRPPYTDASLAEAIRRGADPTGRILNDAMPRYLLADDDMKVLISYLKSLSAEFPPGVTETTIRFATVITDDVSPEERIAMLAPLENYVKVRNATYFPDHEAGVLGARSRAMAETLFTPMGVAKRKLELSLWVLKGPPETWRSQLEEYNRKEPVFALLGGMTTGEWQPVHQFCEENHIPDIFPFTDFPVISQTDWYTLYLSKGYYQEGETAARFLNDNDEARDKPIVQIVRDSREGQTLARGFQETWHDLGQTAPVTITLKAGETLAAERLQELTKDKPAAIVLWDGPESLKTLEMLAAKKNRPAMVLASSSYLGKSMFSLNEQARDYTYITYPYAMPAPPQDKNTPWLGTTNFNAEANAVATTRISQQSYILTVVLNMALLNMRGDYYRDNLLDVIGTIMDQDVPLYGRLSFGTGQRYASKGCYIVQLGKTGLLKKIGWVTP